MKINHIFIIITFYLFLFFNTAKANNNAEIIFPILNIGIGARADGMAGAFSAVADDITTIYWNPAGLYQIKNLQIGLSFNKWFMDSFLSHIMLGTNFGPGSIGLKFFYMNFGTFNKIDSPLSDVIDKIHPYSLSFGLAYGIGLGENFSIGISGKFILQSLFNQSNTGLAGDLGLLYKTGIFSMGFCVRNLGTGGDYLLPLNITPSLALKIVDSKIHTLIMSSDFSYILNSKQEVKFGIEYGYEKLIYLRSGYKYNFLDDYLNELKEISIGLGLYLGYMQLNYAYVPYGEIGASHNITLMLSFGMDKYEKQFDKIVQVDKTPTPSPQKPKKTQEELYDMLATGGTFENAGKLDQAEQKYREILSYDEKYADAWKRLGAVLFKKKMVKEAIECFEIYIKLRPDDKAVKKWLEKNKK